MSLAAATASGYRPFDPSQIFESGFEGVFLDPSDSSTLFQERTGASATTAAGVGDPVGTVLDKSGNGFHAIAPSDAARPILREASGIRYLEFDGTDDDLLITGWTRTATAYCGFGINVDASETFDAMVTGSTNGVFFGVYQDGDASAVAFGAGTPVARLDGAVITTRDQLHDGTEAIDAVVEFASLDLTGSALWDSMNLMGGYAFLRVNGRLYPFVLSLSALNADVTIKVRNWLALKSGVTL